MKIIQKKDNPLLSRQEIIAEMDYEKATPTTASVKDLIAKQANAQPEMVLIKHIQTAFGARHAKIKAYVYTSAEEIKRIERPKVKKAAEKKE